MTICVLKWQCIAATRRDKCIMGDNSRDVQTTLLQFTRHAVSRVCWNNMVDRDMCLCDARQSILRPLALNTLMGALFHGCHSKTTSIDLKDAKNDMPTSSFSAAYFHGALLGRPTSFFACYLRSSLKGIQPKPTTCLEVSAIWKRISEMWGIPSPYKSGAQNYLFTTTSQLNGNFHGLYLRNETWHRQSGKCDGN